MIRLPPILAISLGLVSVTISAMLVGNFMTNLVQDQESHRFAYRRALAETLAVQYSSLASREHFDTIELAMHVLVERNPEIVSSSLVGIDGTSIAQTELHETLWTPLDEHASTSQQIQIPIFQGAEQWGNLQVRFEDEPPASLGGFLENPWFRFITFVACSAFLAYFFFMKRTLKHLDPSSVVPKRVKAALDNLEEGVVVLDTHDRIILANTAFLAHVGKEGRELLGQSLKDLDWVFRENEAPETFPWTAARKQNAPEIGVPLILKDHDGTNHKMLVNSSPISDDRGMVSGVLTSFNDVTELDQANNQLVDALKDLHHAQAEVVEKNAELQHLATRDPLTGCFNRRAFFEQLDEAFTAAQTDQTPLSCIMLDIDHFKSFNDRYGHAVGDQVIQVVVKTAGEKLRPTDFVGRYGGEEFCVILPGAESETAAEIAERIRDTIELEAGARIRSTEGLRITSSFGVSSLSYDTPDGLTLIDHADKALYAAKETGRNRVIEWMHIREASHTVSASGA